MENPFHNEEGSAFKPGAAQARRRAAGLGHSKVKARNNACAAPGLNPKGRLLPGRMALLRLDCVE
ncbi:hypothetical protein [Cupriavidus lacunae]|uniref:hypothetical protein n=1 Tax=Cupriavidus lacunae TaxID=2666307 RepID=UPI001058952C|nr:hypothetical protein [Cupriavidus lacunae]